MSNTTVMLETQCSSIAVVSFQKCILQIHLLPSPFLSCIVRLKYKSFPELLLLLFYKMLTNEDTSVPMIKTEPLNQFTAN